MSHTHHKFKLLTALFFASTVSASVSCAAPSDRGRPQGPPPEATEACAELSEGDACSFTGRRNDEITGTCMTLPNGNEGLACAPEGGPPRESSR